eukprot:2784-Heterococcus_DN1.PRE.5
MALALSAASSHCAAQLLLRRLLIMRFILGDRAAAEATSQLAFCCLFKTAPAGAEPGKREQYHAQIPACRSFNSDACTAPKFDACQSVRPPFEALQVLPKTCTVGNLEARLQASSKNSGSGWPAWPESLRARLTFGSNMHLRSNRLLRAYGIGDGSVLHVGRPGKQSTQMAVTLPLNITYVDVTPESDTLGSLRELLARRQQLSRNDFDLCADGEILDVAQDNRLLKTVVNLTHPELTVTMKVVSRPVTRSQPQAAAHKRKADAFDCSIADY